jgi:fermentation-respiration switch protein FrsA (DUF1100 family)
MWWHKAPACAGGLCHPALLAVAALAAGALLAQTFIPATYFSPIDNSEQAYALYLPKTFSPEKRYPLVIGLHAEESSQRAIMAQLFGVGNRLGVGGGFLAVPEVEFIVACPFARGTMGYQGIGETDVYDVLADVKRRYPVDEDRVYLTGVSMGGGGALWLALTRPDVWAAVAPLCPSGMPEAEELAPNALNLPVRLFQGELDPAIPAASTRAWQKRLMDAGAPVEYIEYPGARHNLWDFAYRNGSLFEYFAGIRRKASPDRVRLVARAYRHASAYWVRIDGLTPGALASIDATRVSRNEARIETRGVDGFSLLGDALSRPAVVRVDGAALRIMAGGALSFSKTAGRWRQGLFQPAGKRPGAEGPIAAAVSGRHLYVYGTADQPPPEELEARRRTAQRAAEWSGARARVTLSLPVKADSAVDADDLESADLVLFGTRQTNSLIARFAPQLPLELNAGAADYGLLFIAPVGKRYALVNSGLPWWTGAEDANRGGPQFAPGAYRLLRTFGDFILFKGSLAHVVFEGRFDRNWKVPPDASAAMLATGTITIH